MSFSMRGAVLGRVHDADDAGDVDVDFATGLRQRSLVFRMAYAPTPRLFSETSSGSVRRRMEQVRVSRSDVLLRDRLDQRDRWDDIDRRVAALERCPS